MIVASMIDSVIRPRCGTAVGVVGWVIAGRPALPLVGRVARRAGWGCGWLGLARFLSAGAGAAALPPPRLAHSASLHALVDPPRKGEGWRARLLHLARIGVAEQRADAARDAGVDRNVGAHAGAQ